MKGHMGKPVPTGTLTLDQADPHLGGTVTFTAVYDPPQHGEPVYVQVLAYDSTGKLIWGDFMDVGGSMVLGGSEQWLSGPANCHTELYYWTTSGKTIITLATCDFAAAA